MAGDGLRKARGRLTSGTRHGAAPTRCPWCGTDPLYVAYHDKEWGSPVRDDRRLFEMLVLEGTQAGLSWLLVLRRRAHYRRVFHGFDPVRIAAWSETDVRRLLGDPGIIRNRSKIEAAIANARATLRLAERDDTLANWLWRHVDGEPLQNAWRHPAQVPTRTPVSETMSRELRRLGFRFVGPVICYAFMQAVGMVNDHLVSCHRYRALGGGAEP